MTTLGSFLRSSSSNSGTRTAVLVSDVGEITTDSAAEIASIKDDIDNLSLSKKTARNLNQKLEKKNCSERYEDGESEEVSSFSGCLNFRVKGYGCRVGSYEEMDTRCKRRFSSAKDCKQGKGITENAKCMSDIFWGKGFRKDKGRKQSPIGSSSFLLPDDVLEVILVMLPWKSVLAARSVCRKWRRIIGTTHFTQRRTECCYRSPWLFLFGITRHGVNGGEMHALDVTSDQWYRSSHEELKDRSLFSIATVGTDVYVVGGCSALANAPSSSQRSYKKALKEVLVFSPLKGAFCEAAPMKEARSEPILGVFDVDFCCEKYCSQVQLNAKPQPKARWERDMDVYEDPHRYSLRCQLRDALNDEDRLSQPTGKQFLSRVQQGRNHPNVALIAVGGYGSWDEPLDSGEIYYPVTNRWVQIAKLPSGFGHACCGAICGGMLYVYSEADKLASFDLNKGFWMVIQAPLPLLRLPDYYPKLVSCRARLFVLCVSWCEQDGPRRREKAVRKMWELDTESLSWRQVSRHPDAPMDRDASFVADQNKIYGVEMFRIFGQMLDFITACNVSEEEMRWKRISKKHAANEADASSCIAKSMVVVNL